MTTPRTDGAAQVWMGLVRLKGDRRNPILAGSCGAYATFLTVACDRKAFSEGVHVAAEELSLQCAEVLWSEPLAERLERFDIDDYLLSLALQLEPDGGGLFGKFHSWDRDE